MFRMLALAGFLLANLAAFVSGYIRAIARRLGRVCRLRAVRL